MSFPSNIGSGREIVASGGELQSDLSSIADATISVFVSYARGTAEHNAAVQQLAKNLVDRDSRIHPFLDVWKHDDEVVDNTGNEPWGAWILRNVHASRWVIIVVNRDYNEKFLQNQKQDGAGRGVHFEGSFLINHFYNQQKQIFIPVVLEKDAASFTTNDVPYPLQTVTRYFIPQQFDQLLRVLLNQPEFRRYRRALQMPLLTNERQPLVLPLPSAQAQFALPLSLSASPMQLPCSIEIGSVLSAWKINWSGLPSLLVSERQRFEDISSSIKTFLQQKFSFSTECQVTCCGSGDLSWSRALAHQLFYDASADLLSKIPEQKTVCSRFSTASIECVLAQQWSLCECDADFVTIFFQTLSKFLEVCICVYLPGSRGWEFAKFFGTASTNAKVLSVCAISKRIWCSLLNSTTPTPTLKRLSHFSRLEVEQRCLIDVVHDVPLSIVLDCPNCHDRVWCDSQVLVRVCHKLAFSDPIYFHASESIKFLFRFCFRCGCSWIEREIEVYVNDEDAENDKEYEEANSNEYDEVRSNHDYVRQMSDILSLPNNTSAISIVDEGLQRRITRCSACDFSHVTAVVVRYSNSMTISQCLACRSVFVDV
jgi:hypothetical protein